MCFEIYHSTYTELRHYATHKHKPNLINMSSESNTATNGYVPEVHYLPPTDYVPNSPLPYLVYRNVLPMPVTEESCKAFIERNGWVKTVRNAHYHKHWNSSGLAFTELIHSLKGPVWRATAKRHFHPNVHECYGNFQVDLKKISLRGTNIDEEFSVAAQKF